MQIRLSVAVFLLSSLSAMAQTRDQVSLQLVSPSEDMPSYSISNAATSKGPRGKTLLTFEYRRLKAASNIPVEVAVRIGNEANAERMFSSVSSTKEEGTYTLRLDDTIAAKIRSHGAEIFIFCELLSSRRTGGGFQDSYFRFKISESITVGRAEKRAQTRPPNAEDERRIEAWRKYRDMQEAKANSIPDGWIAAREARVMMPGMQLRVMKEDVWQTESHEYLGKDDWGYLLYRVSSNSREIDKIAKDNAVFSEQEIAKHRETPSFFKPSLKLIGETGLLIPEQFILRPTHTKVVDGMPVKVLTTYYRDPVLYDGFVQERQGFSLVVRYRQVDRRGKVTGWETEKFPLDEVLVSEQVLAWVDEGNAEERFKPYLSEDNTVTPLQAAGLPDPILERQAAEASEAAMALAGGSTESPSSTTSKQPPESAAPARKLKAYPMKIGLPKDASVVSADVPLQPGVKLGCSWAGKWFFVTVLGWYDDGAVRIRWDDYGEAWDCDVARSDLAIMDRTRRLLERDAASPKAGPRKWSDRSGKFSILAYAIGVDEEAVQLRKPDGSELSVPIDKLSDKDQQVLAIFADP